MPSAVYGLAGRFSVSGSQACIRITWRAYGTHHWLVPPPEFLTEFTFLSHSQGDAKAAGLGPYWKLLLLGLVRQLGPGQRIPVLWIYLLQPGPVFLDHTALVREKGGHTRSRGPTWERPPGRAPSCPDTGHHSCRAEIGEASKSRSCLLRGSEVGDRGCPEDAQSPNSSSKAGALNDSPRGGGAVLLDLVHFTSFLPSWNLSAPLHF